MNLIILSGRLDNDPEPPVTEEDNTATFDITYPLENKDCHICSSKIQVITTGNLAIKATKILKKDSKILVSGSLVLHSWKNRDMSTMYEHLLIADDFEIL